MYKPDEGYYLTPRAPTDAWNMWSQGHVDRMLGRLISGMRARVWYYADATYTTQVGHYSTNCYGAPYMSGTATPYTTGFAASCDPSPIILGIYQCVDLFDWYCPAGYDQCMYWP